jgi:guanylate kinase
MANKLVHLEEFKKLLSDYKISVEGQQLLKQIKLVLLMSPTGSGRNTVIKELLKAGKYHFIVSDTTRSPRVNNGIPEQDGREYWFRSEVDVLEDLRKGLFLEAAIIHNQQASGISLRELKQAVDDRKIAITDVEVAGANNIHEVYPEAVICFMIPPSFQEWIRRIRSRGHMSEVELYRRLESAVSEITSALEQDFYKFIVNDTVENAVERIEHYSSGGQGTGDSQANARTVAQDILTQLLNQENVIKNPH